MGYWTTTAPTDLKSSWTTTTSSTTTDALYYTGSMLGYDNFLIHFWCRADVSTVWLSKRRFCIRITIYSGAGKTSSYKNSEGTWVDQGENGNYPISTCAIVKDKNGTVVRSSSAYGSIGQGGSSALDAVNRGTYYYIFGKKEVPTQAIGGLCILYSEVSRATRNDEVEYPTTGNKSAMPDYGAVPWVKVGGTWREVDVAYVKVGGVWREVEEQRVKYNGSWKSPLH